MGRAIFGAWLALVVVPVSAHGAPIPLAACTDLDASDPSRVIAAIAEGDGIDCHLEVGAPPEHALTFSLDDATGRLHMEPASLTLTPDDWSGSRPFRIVASTSAQVRPVRERVQVRLRVTGTSVDMLQAPYLSTSPDPLDFTDARPRTFYADWIDDVRAHRWPADTSTSRRIGIGYVDVTTDPSPLVEVVGSPTLAREGGLPGIVRFRLTRRPPAPVHVTAEVDEGQSMSNEQRAPVVVVVPARWNHVHRLQVPTPDLPFHDPARVLRVHLAVSLSDRWTELRDRYAWNSAYLGIDANRREQLQRQPARVRVPRRDNDRRGERRQSGYCGLWIRDDRRRVVAAGCHPFAFAWPEVPWLGLKRIGIPIRIDALVGRRWVRIARSRTIRSPGGCACYIVLGVTGARYPAGATRLRMVTDRVAGIRSTRQEWRLGLNPPIGRIPST